MGYYILEAANFPLYFVVSPALWGSAFRQSLGCFRSVFLNCWILRNLIVVSNDCLRSDDYFL